jgi:tRNA G37 N-methylase Trm5
VKGLLRGAKLNRHEVQLLKPDDSGVWPNVQADASQIVLMPLPNEDCVPVFRSKADIVNMGLLPDCLAGLPIAVAALKDDGGVIRVHGEARVATGAKEASRCAWANAMAERLVELAGTRWAGITRVNVRVQAITHVKTLGKELAHLVADIELRS